MAVRTSTRRLRTAVVAVAIAAALLTGVGFVATVAPDAGAGDVAAAATASAPAQPDAASAAAVAAQTGLSVEDLSRRTEREQTFANPDGTWTNEQSTTPVRVRRADGSWVPVDL